MVHILDQNGTPLLQETLEEPGMQYCFTLADTEGLTDLNIQILALHGGTFLIDNPTLHSTCTQGVQVANVMSTQDYYPFGMVMPGRNYQGAEGYRYGFNGKEMDNEVSGNGNQYDYGFRIYNPRLGKFLSVDMMLKETPGKSTYHYAGNSPIIFIDFGGNFKLPAGAKESDYPKLTNLLKNIQNFMKDNPDVMKWMSELSGLSEKEILEHTEFGKGPELVFNELGKGVFGSAHGSDGTYFVINEDLINNFEQIHTDENLESFVDHATMILRTLLHEDVHIGEILKNGEILDPIKGEKGDTFEELAFGDSQTSLKNNSFIFLRKLELTSTDFLEFFDLDKIETEEEQPVNDEINSK